MKDKGYAAFRKRLDKLFVTHADRYVVTALMKNGSVLSLKYSRLAKLTESVGKLKEQYRLRDGDRVLLLEPVIADALISFLALAANHLTVVFADAGVPKNELVVLIGQTEVSAVFTDRKRLPLVDFKTDVPIFQCLGLKNELELLREAVTSHPDYKPTPDSCTIIFSSGTTLRMKPVEISYEALYFSGNRNFHDIHLTKDQIDLPALMVYPMSHISGLACSFGFVMSGITVASVENVDSSSLVKALHEFDPVSFGMVPKVLAIFTDKLHEQLSAKHILPLYTAMRRVSSFFRVKLHCRAVGRVIMTPFRQALFGRNLRTIPSGGAPCIPGVSEEMMDLGIVFIANYSSTECGVPICQTNFTNYDSYDSVGKADCDKRIKIKINAPDSNGIGEIYIKTAYGMNGYYNDPELTAQAMDGGWFRTGDNGFIDKRGNLHISGRSKDSILLASGKKVSPDDLELLIFTEVGNEVSLSVVGVPDSEAGCDMIYIFIADKDLKAEEKKQLSDKIRAWQRREAGLYPITGIEFISELPKTSIGKVKRNELRRLVTGGRTLDSSAAGIVGAVRESPNEEQTTELPSADVLEKVNEIVMRCAGIKEPLTGYEDLTNDLGIDSLTMMEICTEIENTYGVFIGSYLLLFPNTIEISEYIKDPFFFNVAERAKKATRFKATDYPKKRKLVHKLAFRLAGKIFFKNMDFEVTGLENIVKGEIYIYCPNHQTHADGLWVWTALGDKCPDIDSIGCMAKKEHLDAVRTRFMLTALGGIPVDRAGNTTDSFERSLEFIREGNSFLIHPEGTRTRDGSLGSFKQGAAMLSKATGVSIVPVAISGGFEAWPYNKTLPSFRDKQGRKRRIEIHFCDPISPEEKTPEEITELARREIEGL